MGRVFSEFEIGQRFDRAPHHPDFRAEDLALKPVVGDLPFFGVEHGYRHPIHLLRSFIDHSGTENTE